VHLRLYAVALPLPEALLGVGGACRRGEVPPHHPSGTLYHRLGHRVVHARGNALEQVLPDIVVDGDGVVAAEDHWVVELAAELVLDAVGVESRDGSCGVRHKQVVIHVTVQNSPPELLQGLEEHSVGAGQQQQQRVVCRIVVHELSACLPQPPGRGEVVDDGVPRPLVLRAAGTKVWGGQRDVVDR